MSDNRTFEYLLNRVERAAASDDPAANRYGMHRKALFAYVAALQSLANGQDALLVAYRTGARRTPGAALDKIRRAREVIQASEASCREPAAALTSQPGDSTR
jgi:hypothetical protein